MVSAITGTTAPSTACYGQAEDERFKRLADDMSTLLKSFGERASKHEAEINKTLKTIENKADQSEQFDILFKMINENMVSNQEKFLALSQCQEAQEETANELKKKISKLETIVAELHLDKQQTKKALNEFKALTSHQICVLHQKIGMTEEDQSNQKPSNDINLQNNHSYDTSHCSGNDSPRKVSRSDQQDTVRTPTHD